MILAPLSFFVPGYAILHGLQLKFSPAQMLALSPACSYFLYGLLVLPFLALRWPYDWLAGVHVIIMTGGVFYIVRRRLHREILRASPWPLLSTLVIFASAAAFLTLPARYEDIPNLLSRDLHHTRVPDLAGDSYLPYRTAQFVLHRLDPDQVDFYFGHRISERSPWPGLVTAYWLSALRAEVPAIIHTIGGFWIFEITGTFLNSLPLLGVALLGSVWLQQAASPWLCLFVAANPFLFMHTVYTRPGNLVAYLVLLSFAFLLLFQREGRVAFLAVSAFCAGLGYLSHPLAAAYIVGAGIYLLVLCGKTRNMKAAAGWALIVLILFLPWEGWTRLVYKHPSVFYNYPAMYGGSNPYARMWSWIVSAHRTIAGYYFSANLTAGRTPSLLQNFLYDNVYASYLFTLPGALTLSMTIPAYCGLAAWFRSRWRQMVCFVLLPFSVMVVVMPTHVGQATYGMHALVLIGILAGSLFLDRRPVWRWCVLGGAAVEVLFVALVFLYPLRLLALHASAQVYFLLWIGALCGMAAAARRTASQGDGVLAPRR